MLYWFIIIISVTFIHSKNMYKLLLCDTKMLKHQKH